MSLSKKIKSKATDYVLNNPFKVVLLLIALYYYFFKMNSKKSTTISKFGLLKDYPQTFQWKIDSINLDNDLVNFLQKKEGGLSKDSSDGAAAFPSPWDGYHTNKGITYETFSKNTDLGYKNTKENFFSMPYSIWLKIFTEKYYKPFRNLTSSKLINYYISTWAWGSGVTGANNLLDKIGEDLQTLINIKGEAYTLEFLVNERIKFYDRLIKQKPSYEKFRQGWINTALSFNQHFQQYARI